MERGVKKYEINTFIANSRLVKALPVAEYTVVSGQLSDIKCGKWNVLVLTMGYHIKFPWYISNKIGELSGKLDFTKLLLIVIAETPNETDRFPEVQMMALQKMVKVIPCFNVDEARGVL